MSTRAWKPDVLGPDFEQLTIPLGKDSDTGKTVQAVLVRHTPSLKGDKPAVLWVHGMSDYFFQDHVAEEFAKQGYPFYGLDLRRCGRAHKKGERFHFTLDMARYFEELTAALNIIAEEHGQVIPLAHSTGGLIVPLWADQLRREDPENHAKLAGIILNSPWLDLQFNQFLVKLARPLIDAFGFVFPSLPLPGGGLGAYGKSIYKGEHGEWDFNTTWKPVEGHRKYLGWIRAVILAQRDIHSGEVETGVPTLTMCSSHSYLGEEYSPAADTADTVLDVEQIQNWAPQIASQHTLEVIDGARHDVFLSERHAREAAFKATFAWLDTLNTTSEK